MTTRQWLLEWTRFYRELGFLNLYSGLSTEEFVDLLEELDCEEVEELAETLGEVLDDIDDVQDLFSPYEAVVLGRDTEAETPQPTTPQPGDSSAVTKALDLRLLALLDPARVWWRWRDCEGYANSPEARTYAVTLERWARVSQGAFQPTNIEETAGEEPDTATLAFNLNGTRHSLAARYQRVDYGFGDETKRLPDTAVAQQLNPLITSSGIEFCVHERLYKEAGKSLNYVPFNGTSYVLALTAEEQQQIEKERDWSFGNRSLAG